MVSKRFSKIIALLRGAGYDKYDRTIVEDVLSKMRGQAPIAETELAKNLEAYTEDNQHFESLNYLKSVFYETSKSRGWHSEKEINIGNFLCNLHGEVSELWEAWRADTLHKPCDKAEKMKEVTGIALTCAEEELADILIRTLDTAATLNIDIAKAVKIKNEYNKTREHRHGGKLA